MIKKTILCMAALLPACGSAMVAPIANQDDWMEEMMNSITPPVIPAANVAKQEPSAADKLRARRRARKEDALWEKEAQKIEEHYKAGNGNGVQLAISLATPSKILEINHLIMDVNHLNPGKPQIPPMSYDPNFEYQEAMKQAERGKAYPLNDMCKLVLAPKIAEIERLKKMISESDKIFYPQQEKGCLTLQERMHQVEAELAALKTKAQKDDEDNGKQIDVAWTAYMVGAAAWQVRETTLKATVAVHARQLAQLQESRERLRNGLALLPPTYACSNPGENSLIELLKNELEHD